MSTQVKSSLEKDLVLENLNKENDQNYSYEEIKDTKIKDLLDDISSKFRIVWGIELGLRDKGVKINSDSFEELEENILKNPDMTVKDIVKGIEKIIDTPSAQLELVS